jgi:alkylated DNA nucleotide flippase Atl1
MARYGGGVPWHRVVNASGRVVPGHEQEALRRLRAEGTPLRGDRVDLRVAAWWPD